MSKFTSEEFFNAVFFEWSRIPEFSGRELLQIARLPYGASEAEVRSALFGLKGLLILTLKRMEQDDG